MKTIILCLMITAITCWATKLTVHHDADSCIKTAKPGVKAYFAANTYPRSQVVIKAWSSFTDDKLTYDKKNLCGTSGGGGFTLEYKQVSNKSLQPGEKNKASVKLSAKSTTYTTGIDENPYTYSEYLPEGN